MRHADPRRAGGLKSPVCTENLRPDVMVMKSANDRVRTNDSGALNRASEWSIFVQRPVRSDVVVIAGVSFQKPTKVCLTQDQDVIDALAPDRSDQSFGKAILPRRGCRSRLVPDAHGAQSARHHAAVDAITVTDQVLWIVIPRECLGNLTGDPFCRRICRDIDPDKLSAI